MVLYVWKTTPGTWRLHIYSAYYAPPCYGRTRTHTNGYPRVFLKHAREIFDVCGLARPLEAVQRATGTASLPVPLSNQTDPAWSSLLGFCLQIGCSFEYLPWFETTEPLQFYPPIAFPAFTLFVWEYSIKRIFSKERNDRLKRTRIKLEMYFSWDFGNF